jgi:sodium/potassium-transporting ATPase subunit alpha
MNRSPVAVSRRADIAALAATAPAGRPVMLDSREDGLSMAEAGRRLRLHGPNEPIRPAPGRPLRAFLANFTHTLALLLWLGAGLSFAAGIPELAAAIVAVVVINGVFAFVQEYRAERVIQGLMRRVAVQAVVLRDGRERRLPALDLVTGDVIILRAGDIAPADCVLLNADNLAVDLSMITGETFPVQRDPAPRQGPPSAGLIDLASVIPAGAAVITGSARALVFATGPESTLGSIAALVAGVDRGQSILERQVAELSRRTAVIAVLAGAATLALAALSTDIGFVTALTFATGVIVALVPEGLLPTLSVALAIGARRMAARGAAVRRLAAVEIVGAATVICTDKTGTLTQNAASVLGFVPAGAAPTLRDRAVLAAALCNDAHPDGGGFEGDPLDVALARWVVEEGQDSAALRRSCPRLADRPFDAHRRFMSVTCMVNGQTCDFIKGAPETVAALAGLDALPEVIGAAMAAATARGERVLLLAAGPSGRPPDVLGLVRLHDPPRPGVPEAVAACQRAGIRVVMVTGDHPATARALAAAIGLGDADMRVAEGQEIDALGDAELVERLKGNAVIARTDPQQKLRIVTALRRSGEVVVVTGDGINDAPALRAADVGVAMGRRGTEVAKQAADIVLADDNFTTIVAAIEEGRSIKANIRRFVSYVFTSNVAELAPFLCYIFLPVPLPLAIMQVLAIDLGTDLLPALALGVEPASADTMRVPPEPPHRPLLTRALALNTFLIFGLAEAALGLSGFFGVYALHGWRPFASLGPWQAVEGQARTMTFLGIVSGQIGCLFAQRAGSLRARLSLRRNPWVAWGLLFEIALTVVLVYVPGINRLFAMTAAPAAWLLVLPAGAVVFGLVDAARRLGQKRSLSRA